MNYIESNEIIAKIKIGNTKCSKFNQTFLFKNAMHHASCVSCPDREIVSRM